MTDLQDVTGKWDQWYSSLTDPEPYGDTRSYRVGAEFLSDCALVEDWGCGKGWLTQHIPPARYRGVDGSRTPYATVLADLCEHRSTVDGVFLRHVLEHNVRWRDILDNVLASAQRRAVVIVHTPFAEQETQLRLDPIGVPDLSLPLSDITDKLSGLQWTSMDTPSDTVYGQETLFLISKPGVDHQDAAIRAVARWSK